MAHKSRAKFEKRQKEQARQERQKLKRDRRAAARERKAHGDPATEAPDLPGDPPGPLPPQDES